MISVVLIEDNRLVREGMTAMLNQTTDFRVVAAGASGDPALLRDTQPQVILLDVGLWDDDSLRVAETVRKESPDSKVIIMDLLPIHEDIVEFVNAGVSGFILKDATFEDLVTTIRSVADGAHVLPPRDDVFALLPDRARSRRERACRCRNRSGAHDTARARRHRADRRRIEQQGDRIAAQHRYAYGEESREKRDGEASPPLAPPDRRLRASPGQLSATV